METEEVAPQLRSLTVEGRGESVRSPGSPLTPVALATRQLQSE